MLKIFLVDDEKDIRLGLKAIIEREAAECVVVGEASDGKSALAALQALEPDVVITDIKMPVMDGIGLIQGIKELGLDTKIIVLSGYDEYKYVREALRSGAEDYLIKPIDKTALLELLEKTAEKIEDDLLKERQIAQFSEQINSSREVLKEKFLLDLIKGQDGDIQTRKSLEEFGCFFSGAFLFALIDIQGLMDLEKQMLDKFKISANNLLKQQAAQLSGSGGEPEYLSAEYEGKIAVLFVSQEADPQQICGKFYADMELLRGEFFNKTGYACIAGISDVYLNIRNTDAAYVQALTALKERFYYPESSILKYPLVKYPYGDLVEKSLADNISRLVNDIELCNVVNTKKELEAIFERLRNVRPKPDRFRDILKFIVTNVSAVQQEFREVMDQCGSDEYDLIYHIEKEDTCEELKGYFAGAVCGILRHIQEERAHRSKKIVEIAKEYISRNYREDISLKSVADHVHLSPNYFSDLFKNDTGKNFIDFLIEVRINAAKKLLAKPDVKVYEVGQQVGYEDPASFHRAFKKIVSVSPAEYKKLIN